MLLIFHWGLSSVTNLNDIADLRALVEAELVFTVATYSSHLLQDCLAHFGNLKHKTVRQRPRLKTCFKSLAIQRSQQ